MKKFIFTESQIKKIITHQINEQNPLCAKNLLKNANVLSPGPMFPEEKLRTAIQTGKFKVIDISGDVKLNGKLYDSKSVDKGIILTPNTTIEICSGNGMIVSGMNLGQCTITNDQNLKFSPVTT